VSFHLYELLQHSNASYWNLLTRIIEMKQSMSSKHPCCHPHNLAHITSIFATLFTLSIQAPYPCWIDLILSAVACIFEVSFAPTSWYWISLHTLISPPPHSIQSQKSHPPTLIFFILSESYSFSLSQLSDLIFSMSMLVDDLLSLMIWQYQLHYYSDSVHWSYWHLKT